MTRFDEALTKTLSWIKDKVQPVLATRRAILIRDIRGQFRLITSGPDEVLQSTIAESTELRNGLGPFAASGEFLISLDDETGFNNLFESRDAYCPRDLAENIRYLDRTVTGREWFYPPTGIAMHPKRIVFYGFKGGVGRTTALSMVAWHLSRLGKRVLVIDLDIESPGLGSILLPIMTEFSQPGDTVQAGWPSHGLVDWFVEDAVGNVDSDFMREIVRPSPVAESGEVLVVPASGGLLDQDYLSKLSRVYADLPNTLGATELFGDRLERAILSAEAIAKPDVVLLDSRAGIHHVSATALTRLDATVFIFASDSTQTWAGLSHLFRHWAKRPEVAREVRTRLRTVAALVPDNILLDEYRKSYCDSSYQAFAELYDDESELSVSDDGDLFTFGIRDEDAPHFPIIIRRSNDYAVFDPIANRVQLDEGNAKVVFSELFLAVEAEIYLEQESDEAA